MRNANGGFDVVNDPSDSAGKTQTEYTITLQLLYYPNPESTLFAE